MTTGGLEEANRARALHEASGGLLALLALVLLLWATFQSGAFRFGKEEEIYLRFGNVGGLEEGAPVRLNGVPVGIVRKIELEPKSNDVKVRMGVKDGTRTRLHQGASARITTVGFLVGSTSRWTRATNRARRSRATPRSAPPS